MAGPWEKYAAQSPQPVQISPADPKLPGQMDSTAAATARTRQQMAADAELLPLRKQLLAAKIAATTTKKTPKPSPQQITRRNDLLDKLSAMKNLENNLNAMESQYQQNFAGQPASRGFGLSEFLPDFASGDNQKFNKLAKQTGPYIMSILGMSGKATDAAAEYEKKVMPFIPKSSDRDATIAQTLGNLRDMLNAQKASTFKELGVPYKSRARKKPQQQSGNDGWSVVEE